MTSRHTAARRSRVVSGTAGRSRPAVRSRSCRSWVVGAVLAVVAVFVGTVLGVVVAGPAVADPSPAPGPPTTPAPPTAPSAPAPPGTPNPTPGPDHPTSPPDASPGEDDPAWYDISGQIRKGMADLFTTVIEQAGRPLLDTLAQTVLATPDVTGNGKVKDVWTTCAYIANTCFVLLVVAAGYLIAARETLQTRYGFTELAPRIVVAAVAANCSLIIVGKGIEWANALTAAILGQDLDPAGAGTALSQAINPLLPGSPNLLQLVIGLAILVMVIVVLVTYVMRLAILVVLAGVAPIALSCHALPQLEGVAYAWWRAFTSCLAVQVGQALVLLVMLKVILSGNGDTIIGFPTTGGGWIGLVLQLALVYLLIKIPMWASRYATGPRRGPGLVGQITRTYLAVKTLGLTTGLLSKTTGKTAGRTATARGTAGRTARRGTGTGRAGTPARTAARRTTGRFASRTARPAGTAGPVVFSHAPTAQTSMARRAGTAGPVVFSHASGPITPRPAPTGGPAEPVRFSHQADARASVPASPDRPSPPVFSHATSPGTGTARRPSGPASSPTFSSAPRTQSPPSPPSSPTGRASSPSVPPSPRRRRGRGGR